MKTKNLLLPGLFLISAFVVSCKKDASSGTSSSLNGTYDFVSMDASTVSSVSYNDGNTQYDDITDAVWHSKNNTGTVTFDGKNLTSSNLAYSIDTTIKAYYYEDGVLQDSLDYAFSIDIPQSSGSGTYKLVTADSIYFGGGSVFFNGSVTPSSPSGGRLKWDGDILYLTSSASKDTTEMQYGVMALVHDEATITVGLKKH
ncbi:MAG TPA: hypothetical protein VG847_06235 [Chitinophagaceae bacterium]|nr:hypothetical protein [Chitinophagaceae bacterium]